MRTNLSADSKYNINTSLPDLHEKPDRYRPKKKNPSLTTKMKEAYMSPTKKTRYFKTGAILFVLVCLFYWMSPSGVSIPRHSMITSSEVAAKLHANKTLQPPAHR